MEELLTPEILVKYVLPNKDLHNLNEGRVSSTLDKSVGKKYLLDKNPETCWTSQQVKRLPSKLC